MKIYVLYTTYPFEGGYVHGVFKTMESAEKYLKYADSLEWGFKDSYIQEVELDKFVFQQLVI